MVWLCRVGSEVPSIYNLVLDRLLIIRQLFTPLFQQPSAIPRCIWDLVRKLCLGMGKVVKASSSPSKHL